MFPNAFNIPILLLSWRLHPAALKSALLFHVFTFKGLNCWLILQIYTNRFQPFHATYQPSQKIKYIIANCGFIVSWTEQTLIKVFDFLEIVISKLMLIYTKSFFGTYTY